MYIEERIILYFVVLASFVTLGLIAVSPPTGLQVGPGGYCGNDICEPLLGETPLTCPQDCSFGEICGDRICGPTEDSCSCEIDCGPPLDSCDGGGAAGDGGGGGGGGGVDGSQCGNKVCESGESYETCPTDCSQPSQPPPDNPILEFPTQEIPLPEEGETITLPPGGVSIALEPGVSLALFPLSRFNATIYNLSKIDAGSYR